MVGIGLSHLHGNVLAELDVTAQPDDWFAGRVLSQQFPPQLRDALAWYDEVLEGQMLSYLDQATDAVDQFGVRVGPPGGPSRSVYSLHVTSQGEVSFRTTPIPPPARVPKSASA